LWYSAKPNAVKSQKIIIGQNLICNNLDCVLHDSNSLSKIHAKLKNANDKIIKNRLEILNILFWHGRLKLK